MLLESVSSTSKRAEDLLNNINNKSITTEGPIRIEEHFTGDFVIKNGELIYLFI